MSHGFDISGISWCTLWLRRSFQVTFHYIGYNESGRRIDSTYLQGSPARIRVGTNALVPGNFLKFSNYKMKPHPAHPHHQTHTKGGKQSPML